MNNFFIICERDAGLFSLVQQVLANLPRALNKEAIPVVHFGSNCCYWCPDGYQGKSDVWEYYFEPLIVGHSSEQLPEEVKALANSAFKDGGSMGTTLNEYYLSNNFGDHSQLRHECLSIPFEWRDPDHWLRQVSSRLIATFIRPRQYLLERAETFAAEHFAATSIIGVHIRGTDALSDAEPRLFRKNSLVIERYLQQIQREKQRQPTAKIFVATDSASSLNAIKQVFADDVLSYSSILHTQGVAAGKGPTGALMPAYITADPHTAAQNGAEAVVDYLLLKRCNTLIHNGASLARTVLLSEPDLPHHNTHVKTLSAFLHSFSFTPHAVLRFFQRLDERTKRKRKVDFEKWIDFTDRI